LGVEYLVIQTLIKLVYRQLRIFGRKIQSHTSLKETTLDKNSKGYCRQWSSKSFDPEKSNQRETKVQQRKTSCLNLIFVSPNRVISYSVHLEHPIPKCSCPSLPYGLTSSRSLLSYGPALDSKADELPRQENARQTHHHSEDGHSV